MADSSSILFSETQEPQAYDEDLPMTPDSEHLSDSSPAVYKDLTTTQKMDLQHFLQEYANVFSEMPGYTQALEHEIEVCPTEQINPKLYHVPLHLKPHFTQEVDELLS